MGGRGSSSGKAMSTRKGESIGTVGAGIAITHENGKVTNYVATNGGLREVRTASPAPKSKTMTTQEMKTQATQQPKSTATKQNTADIAQRKKNANAFDNVTAARLNTMTMAQLKKLARKAYLYKVGKNSWDPQSESEALSRFDSLVDYQSKSALKKIIMSGKKEAKNYK